VPRNSTGPARSAHQQREFSPYGLVFAQICISASSANANFVRENFNVPQLRKIPDADQLSCRKLPGRVLHHHISSSGDGQPCAGFLSEQRDDFLQISRRN
jgi:hypothetical protein